jgi:two-component system chemotaxis response regulator CheY
MVVNGEEAVTAFMFSLEEDEPYDLICLDIMMPKLDGLKALKMLSSIERERDISKDKLSKKFVITALDNVKDVEKAFELGCEVYVTKPINTAKLIEVMKRLKIDE